MLTHMGSSWCYCTALSHMVHIAARDPALPNVHQHKSVKVLGSCSISVQSSTGCKLQQQMQIPFNQAG